MDPILDAEELLWSIERRAAEVAERIKSFDPIAAADIRRIALDARRLKRILPDELAERQLAAA